MSRQGAAPPDDLPVALWDEGAHGPVIHAVNRAARLAGVRVGARMADMRAICPHLHTAPADPAGDAAALARLALWAQRFSPLTVADGMGLALDTTGTDHLWGGEAAMLAEMEQRLSALGLASDLAVAPTWGAAWGLARFGPVRAIAADPAALHPLPVAALRLSPETVLLLGRLGLKRVGDLAAIPRLSLARRFARAEPGDNPLVRLDQMTGHLPEPLSPPDPPPRFRAEVRLAEPVLDPAPLLPGLCAELCTALARAGQGARRLHLTVWRTDGEVRRIEAAAATATRDPDHVAFLFRDRLERIDAGFGFDMARLTAPWAEPVAAGQPSLDPTPRRGSPEDLARLIDRLAVRLGGGAIARPVMRESHLPERAAALAAPTDHGPVPAPATLPERPLRMFDPPQELSVLYAVPEGPPVQFAWQGRPCRVARWQGPERIAPEWWQDSPGTRLRDYFKVEDDAGRRLWLYREGLAGDGRGGPPRWFVQGMFA